MKRTNFVAVIVIFITVISSCTRITGDGPIVTQNRTTGNFSELGVSISGDVVFRQDNNYKLEIQAQQNILDVIQTPVIGNELVIKFKNDVRVRTHDKILVIVSAPNISKLRISGSGNLRTEGNIQSNDFRVNISGSGNIFVPKISAGNLEAVISGSGDVFVGEGTANSSHLRISGSGSIDVSNVQTKFVNTTTSGSGTMKVNASETLDAMISGSGSVYYRGNPMITTHISGSGKIKPM